MDEERIPFRRSKKYCAACRGRFYERFYLGLFAIVLLLGIVAGVAALSGHTSPLPRIFGLPAIFLLTQWLLIVAHEFGHAFAARAFAYSHIRVLIGNLWGFTWIINRIPIGGFTIAVPTSAPARWQWILYISGGLLVNAALFVFTWLFLPSGSFTDGRTTIAELFLWANLLVVLENLAPYTIRTPFGTFDTDGKLLYHALFRWNRPLAHGDKIDDKIPTWNVWLSRFLKFCIGMVLSISTVLLAILCFWILTSSLFTPTIGYRILFVLFFAVLTGVSSYYTWIIFRKPVATTRAKNSAITNGYEWMQELADTYPSSAPGGLLFTINDQVSSGDFTRAVADCERLLPLDPRDPLLLTYYATALTNLGDARAESTWSRLDSLISPQHSSIRAGIFVQRLRLQMLHDEMDLLGSTCQEFLALPISDTVKLFYLDQLACTPLYENLPKHLEFAELCARRALDLAPGTLTLKGTLGGILAERGNHLEAEPLLRDCYDRSPALHDQGISSFYLALIAEHRGDLQTARTLAERAVAMHPEDWLAGKANALFRRLKMQNRSA